MPRVLVVSLLLAVLCSAVVAEGLDRPWIAATYFYWYQWDYRQEFGSWVGGVYNTPLSGYYDSATYRDNLRSLRTACEWGLTDFFMDYWGPGWKGENGEPREQTVMRAAEELQRRGYNMHMGFYQDADNFDMAHFERNLDPGRHLRFIVENWGNSGLLPRVGLNPVYLNYSRNGAPKPTTDDAGFREWLGGQYPSLTALNQAWGTWYPEWSEVALDFGSGRQRADSIRYATEVWQTQWQRTQQRAREELHTASPRVSFDVAYQPYLGWGYSALAKSLGGPHSYAGIFGPPEDQDAERFIQNAVAKAYGTVFLDHFKNYYHDVEIRTPGVIYPPDFCAFDRFWAGALVRRSEAMLHLSWNEWWEGSNLEPSWEFGKTYCEKNLLWSTVMQRCFGSLHEWNRGAKVAVLLNDWLWLTGGRHTEDVYGCLEALRRSNVKFDLLPDDFVTRDRLANLELVIAPTGAAGLGYNARNEPIADLLKDWVAQPRQVGRGPVRRLIVSQLPGYLDWLGLKPERPARAERKPGPDLNVFVDVGEDGDDKFLVSGAAGRENWGALPKDAFGASDRKLTVRWTPAAGLTTLFVLPVSPYRNHVLRLQGSGFRENQVTVFVNSRKVGGFDVKPDVNEYAVPIPAEAIGPERIVEVKLVYATAIVPQEIDPAHFTGETRVCNLALDWVQLSTDNVPAHTTEQRYSFPKERASFLKEAPEGLADRSVEVDWVPHAALVPGPGAVKSRYASDGAARDLVVREGENEVWYVNGLAGAGQGRLVEPLLTAWAGRQPDWKLDGANVLGALLEPGESTRVAVVYNYDSTRPAKVRLTVPLTGRSLAEVVALSRDGVALTPITSSVTVADGAVVIEDTFRYYAAYEITGGPVSADIPPLVLTPGSTRKVEVTLENHEPRPTTVNLALASPIPTLKAKPASVELTDYQTATVPLEITCAPEADWGEKTVVFDLTASGKHAFLWRKLKVLRQPELEVTNPVIIPTRSRVTVTNAEHPLTASGVAERVRVAVGDREVSLGDLDSGKSASADLPTPPPADHPTITTRLAKLTWTAGDQREETAQPVHLVSYPRQYKRVPAAIAPVLVFNAADKPLTDAVITLPTVTFKRPADRRYSRLYVRDETGAGVPSQVSADETELFFLASVKPNEGRTYYACLGEAPKVPTELAVTPQALGSGHGRVTLGNQALELVLDEEAGGTAVSFRSLATNAEYGARSFGAAYGTWGRFDPLAPAADSGKLLAGLERHSQAEGPVKLTLVESGPVRAVVRAEWRDRTVAATQEYTVCSRAPYVRLAVSATPLRRLADNEEVVILDGRLKRAALTKIFPNFVGITEAFNQKVLHQGWRLSHYVPDYFTAMTPNEFRESVSFVLLDHRAVDSVRQGFWPAERGKPGPCEYAWVELLTHGDRPASALVDLFLHPGHQVVARDHLDAYRHPPTVIVPDGFQWEEEG